METQAFNEIWNFLGETRTRNLLQRSLIQRILEQNYGITHQNRKIQRLHFPKLASSTENIIDTVSNNEIRKMEQTIRYSRSFLCYLPYLHTNGFCDLFVCKRHKAWTKCKGKAEYIKHSFITQLVINMKIFWIQTSKTHGPCSSYHTSVGIMSKW